MFSKQLLEQKSCVTQPKQNTSIDLAISRWFTVYCITQLLYQVSKREKGGMSTDQKELIIKKRQISIKRSNKLENWNKSCNFQIKKINMVWKLKTSQIKTQSAAPLVHSSQQSGLRNLYIWHRIKCAIPGRTLKQRKWKGQQERQSNRASLKGGWGRSHRAALADFNHKLNAVFHD